MFNNNQDSEYANSDLPLQRFSNDEYANAEDEHGKTGRYVCMAFIAALMEVFRKYYNPQPPQVKELNYVV